MKALPFFFILLCCTACGNADQDAAEIAQEQATLAAQDAAYKAMMDGHDRVMPMLGRITQAQRTITEQLTAGGVSEDYRELLLAANEQLEDADDGMKNWMNKIRPLDELREDKDAEEVMSYIKEQTRDIADVEANITSSLANADEIIQGDSHVHDGSEDHTH
ncbi:hypothetical protein LEM8419_02061 [Neolewinella maritima]|uniref:Cytochrome c n=1 Tax=Neolewinella maritima TaxID=1383882 RepID=A0ABM9B2M0_9BACT|nr:hypothetical protein [Neolewinella maritima]CAH1001140.1 hypothetical protein LEM8419_02061 [Neolewinella maritima]